MSKWIDLIKLNEASGFEVTGVTFAPKLSGDYTVPTMGIGKTTVTTYTNPIPAPVAIPSVGSYVVKFGKFKEQRIDQIDMYDLDNYVKYLLSTATESNKPIKGDALEFVQTAEQFLEGKTVTRKPRR